MNRNLQSNSERYYSIVLMVKQLVLQIGLVMVHFQIMRIQYKKQGYDVKAIDGHSNITEAKFEKFQNICNS